MLANDDNAIANVFGKIVKSPDEVDLSQEEFVAFMHGRGGLEIMSFEGYYETNPDLSTGKASALWILSVGNPIFWGVVEGFFAKTLSKSEVKYQLGPNLEHDRFLLLRFRKHGLIVRSRVISKTKRGRLAIVALR